MLAAFGMMVSTIVTGVGTRKPVSHPSPTLVGQPVGSTNRGTSTANRTRAVKWGKVIDQTRCIGCHACTTACKSEHRVPLSVTRTYVKYVEVGQFPTVRRVYQVNRCNQCDDPPCVRACPTGAMFTRANRIVDFNKSRCIGCKACIAACPYDAIFINPEDHCAEKCNFCAHRLEVGLEPACVVVCPVEAIAVGDLNNPDTRVAQTVQREAVTVRRPEKGTQPKLFYQGSHQATLNPIAATRPGGGVFLWSEQKQGGQYVVSGHPTGRPEERGEGATKTLVAYDVPHKAPWDWRVSLYTWTKGIASGAYLAPMMLVAAGKVRADSPLWKWVAPIVAGGALADTGLILIFELEHPERFHYLYVRPQRESWLVKGSVVITGYGAALAAHFVANMLPGSRSLHKLLIAAGLPMSALTATYTAYLFAQARGRDLWQTPLLVPHLLVQALQAGAGAMLPLAAIFDRSAVKPLGWVLAASNLAHLLLTLGETTLPHPTEHAHLATWEMVQGRYRRYFWASVALSAIGVLAPALGVAAAPPALAGTLAYEHAYVQAGQSVPLA
jgi:Fe-S-cluster-containing dehydrogenase component/formate-dependent nitrite reductase membrane component NrfD